MFERRNGAVVIANLGIADLDVIQNATVSGELAVLAAEFKISLNAYLSDLSFSPVRSLADIIQFNNAHPDEVSSEPLFELPIDAFAETLISH